jgi:nitrogen fixation/metabolism regulation signal transduction histidine kinase
MVSDFRLNVLVRVSFLCGTCLLMTYLVVATNFMFSSVLVVGAAVMQMVLLFRYVNRSNRRIEQVLTAFAHSDFSHTPVEDAGGGSFSALNRAVARLARRIRDERLHMEARSRLLQAVCENADSGLLAFDRDGRIGFLNAAARRLLGVQACTTVDQILKAVPSLECVLDTDGSSRPTVVKAAVGGKYVQLSARRAPLVVQGEAMTVIALHSITTELRDHEREAIEEMIPIITHEIRNSLTPVSSLASTVEQILDMEGALDADSPSLGDVRDALQAIRSRSEGLLEFIEAYQSLVRLPAPEKAPFLVAGLFDRVFDQLAREITRHGVDIEATVSPRDLHMVADARLIEQVVLNLLLNALQAVEGREGAKIEMQAAFDEMSGKTRISLHDNGSGIPEAALEKVFRPFFSTRPEGTGIGLAMCQRIVHRHGGELSLSSTVGAGTTVELVV